MSVVDVFLILLSLSLSFSLNSGGYRMSLRGIPTPKVGVLTIIMQFFWWKLHENERILTPREACVPGTPLDLPMLKFEFLDITGRKISCQCLQMLFLERILKIGGSKICYPLPIFKSFSLFLILSFISMNRLDVPKPNHIFVNWTTWYF